MQEYYFLDSLDKVLQLSSEDFLKKLVPELASLGVEESKARLASLFNDAYNEVLSAVMLVRLLESCDVD